MKRNIQENIKKDLQKKMVFISGPRQVGKTTLTKSILKDLKGQYLLFDNTEDREKILMKSFLEQKLICLDEFHKYNRWKSYLKGIYDKEKEKLNIIVTGSAKLDLFQKSEDSLFGRYYSYQLHPLSLSEINQRKISFLENIFLTHKKLPGLNDLFKFGGFPEPFLSNSETEHRRWSTQRRQILLNEEFREITQIKMISILENLMLMLPSKISAVFSAKSLAEDLKVSIPTIQNWMNTFNQLYLTFCILPFHQKINRSIQKRPKYYLWDWSQNKTAGAKFENLIASHLHKAISIWNTLGFSDARLYYLQDRMGREVDFLIVNNNQPWFLIEAKLADEKISRSLKYFSKYLNIPSLQLVKKSGIKRREGNILVLSADIWLGNLP